jgi:tetratricopeptide (TPR) repeat protein
VRPGPELARAHERVLRQVPRQLPAAVGGFVGREEELAALTSMIGQPGQPGAAGQPGAVVISAIGGTAGVGKTALAVHWAHQVAAQFRDGQLYVNLRGYDPDQPMTPADALAAFLRALGVTESRIAADTGERAAQYRSLLAGRRMLIVLDNAGSVEQVRPLLPATPGCMVIVTSRDALAGLVARDGARRLELDLLPPAEAVALLRELIGERAALDPEATAALAALCARLPLALRVAAEHVVSRPAVPLPDLVDELAGQDSRLDLLSAGGDARTAVRAVFSWSCHGLAAETVRVFRLLGLHPGPDLDSYAVAALAEATPANAQRLLEVLAAAYLVQPAQPGRYVLHDLLRAYARELAAAADGGEGERAALTRLFDHYLGASAAAMDTLFPGERDTRPAAVPAARVLSLTRPAAARAWLEAQRLCLVAASAHMAAHGWPGHATRLARILFSYLDGGHTLDAVTVHTHAVQAARRAGDRAAETTALLDLMLVDVNRGLFRQAVTNLQQALGLYQQAGDRAGVARVLGNLGQANTYLGHYPLAIAQCRQALSMYRQAGDRPRQTHALEALARIYVRQGCYPRADACLREALELGRGQDNRAGRAYVLIHLSQLRLRQGDSQQAADHAHQALEWFRELGNTSGAAHARLALSQVDLSRGRYQQAVSEIRAVLAVYEAIGERNDEGRALVSLAEAEFGRGDSEQAGRLLDQVLALFRETGDRTGEAGVLNLLGTVALAAGQPADASARHAAALVLAAEIGDRPEQARAHRGLGRACDALGETGQARRHGGQALELFTQLGVPEADEVRRELAVVASHHSAPAGPGQLARQRDFSRLVCGGLR